MSDTKRTTTSRKAPTAAAKVPDFDQLLFGLGELAGWLVSEMHQLEALSMSSTDEDTRHQASLREKGTTDRLYDVMAATATIHASTPAAAAVQARALAFMDGLGDEWEPRRHRLAFSITRILEETAGASRKEWAGEYCLGSNIDPFARLDDVASSSERGAQA